PPSGRARQAGKLCEVVQPMGWERRQRGGLYYYRSVRIHGQPRKVYCGTWPAAESYARREAERRRQRQAERAALDAEQMQLAPADRALRAFGILVDLLASAALLLAGCHEHHGCWRRRHDRAGQGHTT